MHKLNYILEVIELNIKLSKTNIIDNKDRNYMSMLIIIK
jgi:hypothetical protein